MHLDSSEISENRRSARLLVTSHTYARAEEAKVSGGRTWTAAMLLEMDAQSNHGGSQSVKRMHMDDGEVTKNRRTE